MGVIMDDVKLRNVVADAVATVHGNELFIQQIRDGEQDDGPYLQAAKAVRAWFLDQLVAEEEPFDE